MKLAEALILRADLKQRIQQLQYRMNQNAKVQDGDQPAENPNELLAELENAIAEQSALIQKINRTNMVTTLENGLSLADAIAERDALGLRQAAYRNLANAGIVTQTRYSSTEIRFVSVVNVMDLQRQADDFAKQHRELDAQIQAENWATDLIEL